MAVYWSDSFNLDWVGNIRSVSIGLESNGWGHVWSCCTTAAWLPKPESPKVPVPNPQGFIRRVGSRVSWSQSSHGGIMLSEGDTVPHWIPIMWESLKIRLHLTSSKYDLGTRGLPKNPENFSNFLNFHITNRTFLFFIPTRHECNMDAKSKENNTYS